jgi:hypothetical protein
MLPAFDNVVSHPNAPFYAAEVVGVRFTEEGLGLDLLSFEKERRTLFVASEFMAGIRLNCR